MPFITIRDDRILQVLRREARNDLPQTHTIWVDEEVHAIIQSFKRPGDEDEDGLRNALRANGTSLPEPQTN
jgi:hypothetical protein